MLCVMEHALCPYPGYGLGGEDAEAARGVLGGVQLPAPEVELVGEGRGQHHADDVQVVGLLLQQGVAVPQTLGDLPGGDTLALPSHGPAFLSDKYYISVSAVS